MAKKLKVVAPTPVAKTPKPAVKQSRTDGWSNVMTGLGTGRDRTKFNNYKFTPHPLETINALYCGDGIYKSVVDIVAKDLFAKPFELPADQKGALTPIISRLNVVGTLIEATKRARLEGGALIQLNFTGAGPLSSESPLVGRRNDPAWKVRPSIGLESLTVISLSQIALNSTDFIQDASSANYGKPASYNVQIPYGGTYTLHASRAIEVRSPATLPYLVQGMAGDLRSSYFGISVLEECYDALENISLLPKTLVQLISEFGITQYTLSNLEQIVVMGDKDSLQTRMENIHMQKNVIRGVLLGKGEEAHSFSPAVTGLADLIDRSMYLASAQTHIPQTRLFGRSPAGENATGESDLVQYSGFLAQEQQSMLIQPISDLLWAISTFVPAFKPKKNVPLEPVFQPYYSGDAKVQTEMRKLQAEVDKLYFDMGVLSPDEIRQNRFENGYSTETVVAGIAPEHTEPTPADNSRVVV
jgi:phage-related protein (TIGR01555 family)